MLRRHLARPAARLFSTSAGGQLLICGTAESHKLGLGDDRADRETPTPVEALAGVPMVHVACGKYHTAALAADGRVFAWGLESSGQLGLGSSRIKAKTPEVVEALSGIGVRSLSCGMYHTLALTEDGEVFSFGFGGSFLNGVGGLGSGERAQLDTPTKIAAFGAADSATGVKAASVSAGGYHSSALDAEGGAWTWGRGEWGRLGHADSSDCYEPTLLESSELGPKVQTILAGEVHTAALTADGTVYTWGRNENWQLGYEVSGLLNAGQSLDAQQEPQRVELPEDAPATRLLGAGELGTVAVLTDGSVYVWGMGRFFEPAKVPGTQEIHGTIVDVSVGAYHLAVLTDTGRMYTFGTGAPLATARVARQQWALLDVNALSLDDRRVLSCSCGPYSTAMIVAP